MRNEKSVIMKGISYLLAFSLALGAFPGSFMTASAKSSSGEELTDTVTGSQLLNIDNVEPEGFDPDDTQNPYGAVYDEEGESSGTLMVPWEELAVLTEDYENNKHDHKWYSKDKGSSKSKALSGFNNNGSFGIDKKNMTYIQSASFDKTGTGRRDVAAYVGFDSAECAYYLWTVDTSDDNKTTSDDLKLWEWDSSRGEYKVYKPIYFSEETWIRDLYAANAYISMTAGDFGRGHETLVIAADFNPRDKSDETGSYTIAFEYDLIDNKLERIGSSKIEHVKSKEYINTVSLAAGDLNGDDVDELIVVLGKTGETRTGDTAPRSGNGETKMLVYDGVPNDNKCIFNHPKTSNSLYTEYKEDGDSYRLTFQSPGVAVGDVDGDGTDEVVVGGYHFLSKNGDNYQHNKAQLLGIYKRNDDGSMKEMVLTDPGMTDFMTWGYWESDRSHPRASVATVAFNGQNGKDLIFFNGQIMTYNPDAGVSVTYTPEIFNKRELKMGSAGTISISNAWVSDVAVGNFDHNPVGREQVYFVIALKHSGTEAYGYKIGMIGATYKDTDKALGTVTGSGFYSTDVEKDDFQLNDADANDDGVWCACHTIITAVDRDTDGLRLRYRDKNYVYSDPKIEAVLQAAPYFDGVQDPGSTVYSIETTYGESANTTTSLDWGVGFTGEAVVSTGVSVKMAIEAGAAFNYTWEWETGWETSYNSSFEATNTNTVLLQRTPIIFYNYDLYDAANNKWVDNGLQVPMPLGPVWSQLSIDDYNKFVDEFEKSVEDKKRKVDLSKYIYTPPVLKKIVDTEESTTENGEYLLGNEGNPEAYLSDWNDKDLTDAEKLSNMADMQLGYSGSSKTQEYAHSEYATDGEGFSGGFSLSYTCQWGVNAILSETMAGFYVSADFMRGTCHYKTTTRGNTVSGTITDLDEKELRGQGLSDNIIRSYQFIWSFGRWYVDLGFGSGGTALEDIEDPEDLEDRPWDNSHVPVYGYRVAQLSMPPQPPVLAVSYADETFTFTWEDENADTVDGYYLYQIVDGEHVRLNDTRIAAGVASFTVAKKDLSDASGNLYQFVATSAVDLPENKELESIWSNEVLYVPAVSGPKGMQEWFSALLENGLVIKKIEKTATSKDGLTDIYTIYFEDGSTATFMINKPNPATVIPAAAISLDRTGAIMKKGETLTLTVTFLSDEETDKNVEWKALDPGDSNKTPVVTVAASASDPAKADVSEAVVTANDTGRAIVTVANKDGSTASCEILVIPDELPPEIAEKLEPSIAYTDEADKPVAPAPVVPDPVKVNDNVTLLLTYGNAAVTYNGKKADPEEQLGAKIDISTLVTGITIKDASKTITDLVEIEWVVSGKGSGERYFYPKLKLSQDGKSSQVLSGKERKKLKSLINKANKEFKKSSARCNFTVNKRSLTDGILFVKVQKQDGAIKLKKNKIAKVNYVRLKISEEKTITLKNGKDCKITLIDAASGLVKVEAKKNSNFTGSVTLYVEE